jgi:hypothetical protein
MTSVAISIDQWKMFINWIIPNHQLLMLILSEINKEFRYYINSLYHIDRKIDIHDLYERSLYYDLIARNNQVTYKIILNIAIDPNNDYILSHILSSYSRLKSSIIFYMLGYNSTKLEIINKIQFWYIFFYKFGTSTKYLEEKIQGYFNYFIIACCCIWGSFSLIFLIPIITAMIGIVITITTLCKLAGNMTTYRSYFLTLLPVIVYFLFLAGLLTTRLYDLWLF